MKREIQKLSRRQESPTAAISRPASPENRGHRVTFADDGHFIISLLLACQVA